MLIKSILSSISTYCMSMFNAPIVVTGKLEGLQRNFLWDTVDGGKMFNFVRWQTMTSPKL